MNLSIVIPAFNEESKIKRDVEHATLFLNRHSLEGEVLVVDDGSDDHTAAEASKADTGLAAKLKIIRLEKNKGKGFAVKTGILASKGEVVLFADSGMCIPYENALPFIKRIRARDLDIALASRYAEGTVIYKNRPLPRRILSRLFHWAAVWIAGLPKNITDSQCGFKLYNGDVGRKLFSQCLLSGFLFDLEIIIRALKQGYSITEFPVEWTCDLDSRLQPASQAKQVLKDLFEVRKIAKKD
ncbi:MAG: glycosyltransferase [Candidatus Aminicenantes bacterium]|nr:glycosyltransferase [Candidatus Aminicenantes bacterium]